jgi:hypothetical protein
MVFSTKIKKIPHGNPKAQGSRENKLQMNLISALVCR